MKKIKELYHIFLSNYFFILLLIIFSSSCQNEVFIDKIELPDKLEITLNGNGEDWSSPIPRKGLERYYVDFSKDQQEYVSYFSLIGPEIGPDAPADELGVIIFNNPAEYFSIGILDGMLYIHSAYNTYPEPTTFILNLQYDYGVTKKLHITITPGSPLEGVYFYSKDLKVSENIESITNQTSFTNGSTLPQKFEVHPFEDYGNSSYTTAPKDNWAYGIPVKIALPYFNGNEWILGSEETIILGERGRIRIPQFDEDKITIEVPPGKKVTVLYTVNFSEAKRDGIIYFTNMINSESFEENFETKVICPTSYEYNVIIGD